MSAPSPLRISVVTIFPDYLSALRLSLVGKAVTSGLVDLDVHDLRDWTDDRHRTVDDTPYGGGAGMVMSPEPWGRALDAVLGPDRSPEQDPTTGQDPATGQDPTTADGPVLLIPTPAGRRFDQAMAVELAGERHLVIACGRYEGIDARVAEHYAERYRVREVSLGDYVLNGGEVAALAIAEAVVRLVPGVLGNPASLAEESHTDGMLEYPVYTKPAEWRGLSVPEVLLSGHHGRVATWRAEQSLERTRRRRPDLLRPDLRRPEHVSPELPPPDVD